MELLKLFMKQAKRKQLKNGAEDKLLSINPKQLVNRVDNIPVIVYVAKYSYTTVRGNKKEGTKYFMFNSLNPNIDISKELDKYMNEFNNDNPNRKLLNVKFLSSECLGYMTL